MYKFEYCSHEELEIICTRETLLLGGWKLLKSGYEDKTEKVYDESF